MPLRQIDDATVVSANFRGAEIEHSTIDALAAHAATHTPAGFEYQHAGALLRQQRRATQACNTRA
jgi:hypothetical protein